MYVKNLSFVFNIPSILFTSTTTTTVAGGTATLTTTSFINYTGIITIYLL